VILDIKAEIYFQHIHPEQGPNVKVKNTKEILALILRQILTHVGYGVSCVAMWPQSQ
jgi:hypothetical protein